MTIELEIGGCRIRLNEPEGRRLEHWPNEQFSPFESAAGAADIKFEVSVSRELPELKSGRRLFDAGSGLWTLAEADGGYLLESLDPGPKTPFNRALVAEDFTGARVYTKEVAADGAWDPSRVLNPVMEVCLLSRLARAGALMLHAAGLVVDGAGYIFTGPSGAGKSTISRLLSSRGARLLNDERIILRGAAKGPEVLHGTPWSGSTPVIRHESAPLKGLYFIKHGHRKNVVSRLPAAVAVSLMVKQSFHPYWDRAGMERILASAQAVVERSGALEYAFLKRPSAADLVFPEQPRHAEGLLARVR